ncbi:MAG TPA: MerR family transcriptional regulator [Pseudonocardiaceae bacterium]|nr:MerR family transcriptional regulator [Pseudonocardiaceae bacterium]
MRIGELAELAGTSTRSLRYYEEQGLLSARRTSAGHRDYDEADLRVVREIRALLRIGFGLEETRPFVECLRSGHPTGDACPASVAVYRRKLAEVEECIDKLEVVRTHLREQLAGIEGRPRCGDTDQEEEQQWPCHSKSSTPASSPR